MSGPPGYAAFKLSFELSPIILNNGIASFIPGGMLPIISLTESLNFAFGLLQGDASLDLDKFFANYQPLPGTTLISQKIGTYPFANQAVAANAVITDPLQISMLMICPARGEASYAQKLATMILLRNALAAHNSRGGTYTIATPSFFFDNCVMLNMRDVTPSNTKQVQSAWQLDFLRPLLTLDQAAQALNSLMTTINNQTALTSPPAWSGLGFTVGQPASLAAPSVVPAATSLAGANTAIPNPILPSGG